MRINICWLKDIQGVRSEKEMVTDYRTNIDAGDSQLSWLQPGQSGGKF